MKKILLIFLVCIPYFVPAEQDADVSAEFVDIISGMDDTFLANSATFSERFQRDIQELKAWWNRETYHLQWLAYGTILIAAGIGIALAVIRRKKKEWLSVSSPSWKRELTAVLAEPLLILLGITGIFIFLIPVLRSVPELLICNVRIFTGLIAIGIAWGGIKIINVFSRRMYLYAQREDNNLDALMVDISQRILRISLFIITAFFIVQDVFRLNMMPLLTGAGVAGLAVAFASRETLSNFFGTIVIIGDKPFRCGDIIRADGITGIVQEIGMRSTRLLTADDSIVLIPNSRIETSSVENISVHGVMRNIFSIGLVCSTTSEELRKAIRILHEICDDFQKKDPAKYKPRIFFESIGGSSFNIKVVIWLKTASFRQEEEWRSEIHLAIVERFQREKLELAYATVTNYLRTDPEHPLHLEYTQEKTPGKA